MDNRQHQQTEHTKALTKGKKNNRACRKMAHCRVKAPLLSQISVWSIKFKQTY